MKTNSEFSNLKKLAFEHCKEFATSKLTTLENQIKEIADALTSETKSSAGDKHETGRAMLQLEREKLGAQLAEAEKTHRLLHKVNLISPNNFVVLGSLVITTNTTYFVAISAGKFLTNDTIIYCISAGTPIAKLLLGKSEGDTVTFNQNDFKILDIR